MDKAHGVNGEVLQFFLRMCHPLHKTQVVSLHGASVFGEALTGSGFVRVHHSARELVHQGPPIVVEAGGMHEP